MGALPGHQDLQPKRVLGTSDDGMLLVNVGTAEEPKLRKYEILVMPNGALHAHPFEPDTTPDQVGAPRRIPLAERWKGVDQLS